MPSTAPVQTHFNFVEKLLSNGFNHLRVHKNYILPPNERPQMDDVSDYSRISVIDLKDLDGSARKLVVDEIKRACEEDSFSREIAGQYAKEIRILNLRLLAAISEAMEQDSDYLNGVFKKHRQAMNINYYPPCPDPNLTLGIAPHSDPGGITVLMQGDVSGLQVLQDGKWFAVEPTPNALVVNLGDQLQVLSNGRFQSVEHRAVTNSGTARITIPTFYSPSMDALVAPAESMVDEEHPAQYREFTYGEFLEVFRSQGLKSKSILDSFKIETG